MAKYRQCRDNLAGDQTFAEALEFTGKVNGNVRIVDGGKVYLRGAVYGDVIVEDGGRVHIYGHISGDLTVKPGAKVIHSGLVAGHATNDGGRLYIDRDGRVGGKVKAHDGETKIEKRKEPKPPTPKS